MRFDSGQPGHASQRLSRREFIGQGLKAGASVTALGSFLAGCAPGGEGPAGNGSQIAININESPWLPSFQEMTRLYEEQTGNTVNLRVFPFDGMISAQINALRNETGEFDLINIHPQRAAGYFHGGFISPLDEIDPGFSWPSEVLEYGGAGRWDHDIPYFSEEGTPYALPVNGNIQVLYYRRDLYEEMGLEPPVTWADALAAAEQVRELDEDIFGYVIRPEPGEGGAFNFLPVLRSHGGDIFADEPHDWTVTINAPEAIAAMETYLELASHGPEQQHNIGQADMMALMQTGRSLQSHIVTAAYADIEDEQASDVSGRVGYAVVPRSDEGEHAPTYGMWHMGIPSHISDDQKSAAYDFLMWLMQEETQRQYAEAGGIVTRQDVYEEMGAQEGFEWMRATAESTPYLRPHMNQPFGHELAQLMGRRINEIVAGEFGPEEGLDLLASEIEPLTEDPEDIDLTT